MTTNLSGEELPPAEGENETPGVPSMEARVQEQENILAAYQGRFPILVNVLQDYFVSKDNSLDFLSKYQKYGESTAEFEGLAEEIRDAIRNSREATPVLNVVLGSQLTASQVRTMLSELLDQMLQQGEFSPEALEEADETETRRRPDADTLVDYYMRRKFALPGKTLSKYEYPLWVWLVASLAVMGFGIGIGYIPWPDFLRFIPITFIALGGIGTAFTMVAMLGLRDELLKPDKEAKREKEKADFKEKQSAKREAGTTLAERVRRMLT